jgi:hypothetical protein
LSYGRYECLFRCRRYVGADKGRGCEGSRHALQEALKEALKEGVTVLKERLLRRQSRS